jgi:hypothetical protein
MGDQFIVAEELLKESNVTLVLVDPEDLERELASHRVGATPNEG